jgi:hypothetical protein
MIGNYPHASFFGFSGKVAVTKFLKESSPKEQLWSQIKRVIMEIVKAKPKKEMGRVSWVEVSLMKSMGFSLTLALVNGHNLKKRDNNKKCEP